MTTPTPKKGVQVLSVLDQTAQTITDAGWSGLSPNRLIDILRRAAPSSLVFDDAERWLHGFRSNSPSLTAWERGRAREEVLSLVEDAGAFLRDALADAGVLGAEIVETLKARRKQRLVTLFGGD